MASKTSAKRIGDVLKAVKIHNTDGCSCDECPYKSEFCCTEEMLKDVILHLEMHANLQKSLRRRAGK